MNLMFDERIKPCHMHGTQPDGPIVRVQRLKFTGFCGKLSRNKGDRWIISGERKHRGAWINGTSTCRTGEEESAEETVLRVALC